MSKVSKIGGLSWVVPFLLGLGAVGAQEGFWGEERRLGPEINGHWASNPTVSADGLTLIFGARSRPGGVGGDDLWIATRGSEFDEFGDVRNLTNVNHPGHDQTPSLSSDGLRLYFARVVSPVRINIFVADWLPEEETFGQPTAVQGQVNTGAIEVYPVISSDERALYFTRNGSGFPNGDGDLYVATRAEKDQPFDDVTELRELNTPNSEELASSLSSDGLTLFFFRSNFRTFSRGWMSTRESRDRPFGAPFPVPGSVNVGSIVGAHYISADWPAPGSKLYFSRCDEKWTCDIREATWHPDCNGNGIDDVEEIAGGDTRDINGNGTPDDCEGALVASTETIEFGDVHVGGSKTVSFDVRNTGIGAVRVTRVRIGSGLTPPPYFQLAEEFEPVELPPGESAAYSVIYTPSTAETNGETLTVLSDAATGSKLSVRLVGSGMEDPRPSFIRGDCTGDGTVNISDAVCTLEWLFVGRADPGCVAATNTDGNEAVDISDPVSLLGFLFSGGPPPVGPFPDCGTSDLETDRELGCETPKGCQQ